MQRVFVDAIRYGEILRRVVDAAEALVVGSKKDRATNIGPLVSKTEAKRVERWIGEAVAAGAILHTGGRRRGTFVTPAVLTDVPADAALRNEEIFGPVVLLEPFSDLTAAINSANGVDTGLHAGVFTHDIRRAMTIANALTVGAVMINSSPDFRIDAMPFGGFKRSGIGREGIESAVEQLTEPKIVAINTGSALE
ncbi:aldehyde dehydrogenase family protein [Saccharopolyspora hattusasensis]|uniref:aldehyde dehydrogenase family protein n=1 Tax=Saccharopolyspora hattusasensis TaxID=1128679 RepID=UPI003D98B9E5